MGAAVALIIIENIAKGEVHMTSVQARAIRRKYRLAARDELLDKN